MIQDEKERYDAALEYATEMHEGQYRKGGEPYITHPVAVAEIVREKGGDTDCVITALFHDLLEDTEATEEEIERIGGSKVLLAVKLLTKAKGADIAEYDRRLRTDPIAKLVKGADRLHNLRSAIITDNTFKKKYIKETEEFFMDLLPEIPEAVEALRRSMSSQD